MKKIYFLVIVLCFAFLACGSKTKPNTKSKAEGGGIDSKVTDDDIVYNAIARIPDTSKITKDNLKAGDVTKFRNKVFIRENNGLWTAIGVANNYDIYYSRNGSKDAPTVVKQAQDPAYWDARKLIIPPAFNSSGALNPNIRLVANSSPEAKDKIFTNVRLAWIGRAGTGAVSIGTEINPVRDFDIRPGDDFGANASYNIVRFNDGDTFIKNDGTTHKITQAEINALNAKVGLYPQYSIEKNPSGHPSRKWSWYHPYNHDDMPQVQFRILTSYSHNDTYAPGMGSGLDTQTVFYRRYTTSGSAGENASSAQFMETVVSKNLWIGEFSLQELYGSKPSTVTMTDELWNKVKDKKYEVFVAEFQEEVTPDPGTSSYQAAAYDGYNDIKDRPTGKVIFINPESLTK